MHADIGKLYVACGHALKRGETEFLISPNALRSLKAHLVPDISHLKPSDKSDRELIEGVAMGDLPSNPAMPESYMGLRLVQDEQGWFEA